MDGGSQFPGSTQDMPNQLNLHARFTSSRSRQTIHGSPIDDVRKDAIELSGKLCEAFIRQPHAIEGKNTFGFHRHMMIENLENENIDEPVFASCDIGKACNDVYTFLSTMPRFKPNIWDGIWEITWRKIIKKSPMTKTDRIEYLTSFHMTLNGGHTKFSVMIEEGEDSKAFGGDDAGAEVYETEGGSYTLTDDTVPDDSSTTGTHSSISNWFGGPGVQVNISQTGRNSSQYFAETMDFRGH